MSEDVDELAGMLGRRLIERRDVLAVQHRDGSYEPDRRPMKMADLRAHLNGKRTIGHYLVSPEGNCRVFAFDIDLVKPNPNVDPPFEPTWKDDNDAVHKFNPREAWLDLEHPARIGLTVMLRCMADGLALRAARLMPKVPIAVAYSGGKGLHVYGFTGSIPSADARALANEVLDSYGCFESTRGANFFKHTNPESGYTNLEIEVFPKQDSVTDLGNLLRLPLGINRKTGQAGFFVDVTQGNATLAPDDPMAALQHGSFR